MTDTYRIFRKFAFTPATRWAKLQEVGFDLTKIHPAEYVSYDDENYTRVPMHVEEEENDIIAIKDVGECEHKQVILTVRGYRNFFGDFYVSQEELLTKAIMYDLSGGE